MRRIARTSTTLAGLVSVTTWLQAQEPAGRPSAAAFDIARAYVLDSTVYPPFFVSETQPLRDALEAGVVHGGTRIAVLEHEGGHLALVLEQLTYHHAAQGDIAGEPWMVSF